MEARQVMGIPRVPGHLGRAPLLALRAVFTGIGRALMIADRPAPAAAPTASNGGAPPPPPVVADAAETTAGTETAIRTETPIGTEAAVETDSGVETQNAAATQGAVCLPLPNYDSLSLASIRARLRGLDVAQLRVLLDYEATHAERADVLGMFERRIEKLEGGA